MSAGASSSRRTVPLDPYALGLLLGDGCLTTATTPSSPRRIPNWPTRSERRSPGIELDARAAYDYVLRHVTVGRGGVHRREPGHRRIRELGLAGTRSATKFVPEVYLYNSRRCPAGACCRDCWTPTVVRSPRRAAPAGSSTRPRRRACATTSSSWSARSGGVAYLADAAGGGTQARAGARAPGSPPPRRATSSTSGCPPASRRSGWRASGRCTTPPAAAGRCASSTASSRPASAETRVHPGRGGGLAVRHRRLPAHAQHPQRRVHHPRRGAEHHAPSR